jgi:hypothetical protein
LNIPINGFNASKIIQCKTDQRERWLVQIVSYNEWTVESIVAEQFQLLGIVVTRQFFLSGLHVQNVK